jgi:glycerol-3-phosphate cytidylyltransferase
MKILTLGSFDLFHTGHVNLLRRCREAAGISTVTVGLNTDDFIARYKGRPPVVSYEDRRAVVEACRYVDEVVPNDQADGSAIDVIARVKPNVICAGAGWGERWFGQVGVSAEMFERMGIEIEFMPYTEGISSSQIRARL